MNLETDAMLVSLSIKAWTARKADKKVNKQGAMANNVPEDSGNYNKRLLAEGDLEAINEIISKARAYHYAVTLPWLDNGTRLLPITYYQEYVATMRSLKGEFNQRFSSFIQRYPAMVDAARLRLKPGVMFNEQDYPAQGDLRSRFEFSVRCLPVPKGMEDFRVNLNEEEVKRLGESLEAQKAEVIKECVADLYKRMYEVIADFYATLADGKRFQGDKMKKIGEFCRAIGRLNFMRDEELDSLRRECMAKIAALKPESIRQVPEIRDRAQSDVSAILAKMRGAMGSTATEASEAANE